MFVVNDDLSIYVTRGDMAFLKVTCEKDGKPYTFQVGEIIRFNVCEKKNCDNVVLQKDFPVTAVTQGVDIILDGNDTKIGGVINKPTDYWYEVVLNPFDNPQTIIGYDGEGTRVFRLFPEANDKPQPEPKPEVIKVIDTELDMTSERPVQNQVIARAFENLKEGYQATHEAVAKLHVTPQMFGAIGDGVADDTEAFTRLSEYIVSEFTTKGIQHEVRIPGGTYRLTDTWAVPKCHIYGYDAKLLFDCHNKSLIDFINYAGEKWCYEVIIEGLAIKTTETENYTNIGIDMDNTSQLICRDVYIFNCHIGINYVNASITTIDRPTIQYCDIAVFVGNYSSTLNITHCDFYENGVGFKVEGYSTSIFVSDSYFEEQDIDMLVEDATTETIITNIVFERIHIVKANLLNKNTSTYVLKTIKSNDNFISANFKFINCHANFKPDGRKHFFAYNDSCDKVTIESQNNRVYYTSSQEGAVIFQTVNNEFYQFVVINEGFIHDTDVELYSGNVRKSGIDDTSGFYSLVNNQLTFNELPDAEMAKSIFYNHYTDRLIYKNANGKNLPIVCGNGVAIEKSYANDLATLKNSFNELLDILKEFKIVSLK